MVTTGANVDTSTPGAYTVTYTVGDLAGNQAQATRTVTVQAGDHSLLVRSLVLLKLEMYIPSHLELTHGQALQMITLICTRYHLLRWWITFTGSAAQDTSIRFLFENAPYPNNNPNHSTANIIIDSSNPTQYGLAIPVYD